ncbi:MAG: hypothetical protein BWK80_16445 [Desulfobacteraceae bacterium IS3]|nr:MAG: hypothetical protein BWK80_16445 [Desulfobacteraceae bacterium IS3]
MSLAKNAEGAKEQSFFIKNSLRPGLKIDPPLREPFFSRKERRGRKGIKLFYKKIGSGVEAGC